MSLLSSLLSASDHASSKPKGDETKRGFTTTIKEISTPNREGKYHYITGLRGILVLESLLWVFLQTFVPTVASSQTPGPEYQVILREVLSVPFWNASLIYNFFIILSMRTICVSFLQNPSGQSYAATVIRRIVRLTFALSIGSGMATLIFSQIGTDFVNDFKSKLPNNSIDAPVKVHDGLAAVNSLFDLFWLTDKFYAQAANSFWPTGTLWAPSVMYFQSFTVYFIMVILPFSRPKWHLQGLALFALGSFWMESWGWYSATGLFFADLATNTTLKSDFKRGLKVGQDQNLPYWVIGIVSASVGLALKYAIAVRPQYVNAELVLHPYLDLSANYSTDSTVQAGPYPRVDDWLLITGILIFVELFESVQFVLSFKPLVWLGERSLSIFIAQSIVFWTAGIKLWLVLSNKTDLGTASANVIVLTTCLLTTAIFSELYFHAIDLPSQRFARKVYIWLTS